MNKKDGQGKKTLSYKYQKQYLPLFLYHYVYQYLGTCVTGTRLS